ncbi:MAG TPA: PilZ domain-containing protein [Leptospiraceae bacterium]|nr:PilZ domain-containing protein [Leptospiraceae bacterium]HMW07669.1 PilZ domain-containing protein [Leptospiraceae bacterium]HMX33803.1 PilZ domain-containing protein [Leptospiraceae bacterium]HMY33317.1 PilZ domain-containing protein [Leptospiraceae bacterium]HMZ63054.1 PilZ domain-containing protein [Leptospiraceae bacterium]
MPQEFSEKRKAQRLTLEAFCDFKNTKGEQEKDCYIQNLGTGGMMVLSVLPHKMGDQVTIHFQVKDKNFERVGVVKTAKPLSENRKHYLKIGKNLHFSNILNIAFKEEISQNDFEYIKFNYLKD